MVARVKNDGGGVVFGEDRGGCWRAVGRFFVFLIVFGLPAAGFFSEWLREDELNRVWAWLGFTILGASCAAEIVVRSFVSHESFSKLLWVGAFFPLVFYFQLQSVVWYGLIVGVTLLAYWIFGWVSRKRGMGYGRN